MDHLDFPTSEWRDRETAVEGQNYSIGLMWNRFFSGAGPPLTPQDPRLGPARDLLGSFVCAQPALQYIAVHCVPGPGTVANRGP